MLNLLGPISMPTKIIIGVSMVVLVAGWASFKTYQVTRDIYEGQIAAEKVIVLEKEKEVLKLDSATLTRALAFQEKQLKQDFENEKNILEYLAKHPITNDPVCRLDDDGLRLWNNENAGVQN